ncbi:MAG: hypothetical protein KAV44_05050 [Bacteroidales bacterium]|nr:hypothetical protein [Bacteroidales bacterium]
MNWEIHPYGLASLRMTKRNPYGRMPCGRKGNKGNRGNMGNIGLVLTSKLYPSNYKRITFIPLYLYTCISPIPYSKSILNPDNYREKIGID